MVVLSDKTHRVPLNLLQFVYVLLCVRVPGSCGILEDGSHECQVSVFPAGDRTVPEVPTQESQGAVGLLGDGADVVGPLEVR